MPLEEKTIVDVREEMARLALTSAYTVTELAEMFGVSRPTVRLWRERYAAGGRGAMSDHSHAPQTCPHRTEAAIEELIVAERMQWGWGSKKIRRRLLDRYPELAWPSRATFDQIFLRRGLIQARPKRRSAIATPFAQRYTPTEPGELTTIDHKGEFRLLNGRYCYPLTMLDVVSRLVLACEALDSTSLARAWPVIERVFREHGLPRAMLSDNGPPFGASGRGKFSTLSVRLMKLDIQPVFIDPGHPEQNGIHERMHRTLKSDACRPPARHLRDQQSKFDHFVHIYNQERPHEALSLQRPAMAYRPSPRPFPSKIAPPHYPAHFEVRRVSSGGAIRWRNHRVFISAALAGEDIAFDQRHDSFWAVHFYNFTVGTLNDDTKLFT